MIKSIRLFVGLSSFLLFAVLLVPDIANASSECDNLRSEVNTALDQIRGKKRCGVNDDTCNNPDAPEEEVQELKSKLYSMKDKGCNPDSKWQIPVFNPGMMRVTNTEFPASTLGGGRVVDSQSYTGRSILDFFNGISLPILFPGGVPPVFNFPYADSGDGDSTGGPTLDCGDWAAQFAKELKKLTGDNKAKYVNDCAGVDSDGHPRPSPNKPDSQCLTGKEYGRFGLIFASYNNKYVTANVNDLWYQTPNQAAGASNVIAYNNPAGGTQSTGTCRLSRMTSCVQPGDIIMVQTNPSSGPGDPYDRWLLYTGTAYYEVTNDLANPVKSGSLRNEYNSMPHEVRRLACSAE